MNRHRMLSYRTLTFCALLLIGGVLLTTACDRGAGGGQSAANEQADAGKPWNRNPPPLPDNPAYKKKNRRIDVVARNGSLFVDRTGPNAFKDWPRPKVALVLTGALNGYIEPCGCAGLENMLGGLSRRQTFINQLAAEGWPLVKLDLGELVLRVGPQSVIKYRTVIDGLHDAMGYDVIGFGPSDLKLPATDLLTTVPARGPTHFVSANVGLLGFDNEYTARYRVIPKGGMKFGVTSVTIADDGQLPKSDDLSYADPAEALAKIVPKLQAEHCDMLVLLVNSTPDPAKPDQARDKAKELARKFPQFGIVVIRGDSDPPPPDLLGITGSTSLLAELSHKGMYVGVVAFYDDAARPFRYQRVPLDARFPDSAAMKQLMTTYQKELGDQGLKQLGALPQAHPRGTQFVGSKTCGECHPTAYAVWQKTPHAHALETLEKLTPPRTFDPECLSCHVTGWEPQNYLPFASGYESLKKTPQLAGNGCENCHGPGSDHVAVESGTKQVDDAARQALRQQMRLTVADANRKNDCMHCHDVDNSPEFKFETFWPKIEHRGKD